MTVSLPESDRCALRDRLHEVVDRWFSMRQQYGNPWDVAKELTETVDGFRLELAQRQPTAVKGDGDGN